MKELVFATHNQGKLKEVTAMPSAYRILGLDDIGCDVEIPETATTLKGNAFLKADYVFKNYGLPCFSDDTGLEVDALGGVPGVYSARYAGEGCNAAKNIAKLLKSMEGITDRTAAFKTVIALKTLEDTFYFEGICQGHITTTRCGVGGFGYDSIFVPKGENRTFAQMTTDEKAKISHRGRAIEKLIGHLNGR